MKTQPQARENRLARPAASPVLPRRDDLTEQSARAAILAEALPYLHAFRGAVVVIKYGGAAMVDADLADSWARDVTLLEHVGLRPVIVHGGGPALTETLTRLGLESTFVDGHRQTSAESARVAEMVLSGRINKEVVSRLTRAGAKAVGLSGTDAACLEVKRHTPSGKDIGFVGRVASVRTDLLDLLLKNGYTPVLSSTAADGSGQPYNINADLVAGAVAGAMRATKLVFLSDVPGIMVDGQVLSVLGAGAGRNLLETGVAEGGMRPKVEAALEALGAGVPRVHLVDGRVRHALLLEFFTDRGVGTLMVPDGAPEVAG